VTVVNDSARELLQLPPDAVGRRLEEMALDRDVVDMLVNRQSGTDRLLLVGDRVLALNRRPMRSHGSVIGSVTTLRDRTELSALERELGSSRATSNTLRAQTHEFANQLHTISGLLHLEEYDEVVEFVDGVRLSRTSLYDEVTSRIDDATVAALLIAKASQAAELGVDLRIAPDSALPPLDDELSSDVATVVGNLVDNAMDAAAEAPHRWVEVSLGLVDGDVEVVVRDSGAGVPPGMEREVFRRGMSSKDVTRQEGARERGIGLSLVHLLCTRRGGDVTASSAGGSTFTATLPVQDELVGS
jgi:sensor histidine kinase regulating citrate/malate metabolism